jgi:DNA-binding transcriptional LysR family regulator
MEERLRKFSRVVETGSFTQASQELHISQPALSIAIRKLEHELDTVLFTHRQPPLKLTSAGEVAYRYAKSLGARNRNFKLELAQIIRQKPSLSVGMIDSLAYALFVQSNFLEELQRHAHISLSINNSRILTRLLQQGELNIALITHHATTSIEPNVSPRLLGHEPLVAVTHSAQAGTVTQALKNGVLPHLLAYDQFSNTDRLIQQYFIHRGIEPEPIFRSTSPEILLHMALMGQGTAVLPYLMVREALQKEQLVITAGAISRPVMALEHKDSETPLPLLLLCKNIEQTLKELWAEDALRE